MLDDRFQQQVSLEPCTLILTSQALTAAFPFSHLLAHWPPRPVANWNYPHAHPSPSSPGMCWPHPSHPHPLLRHRLGALSQLASISPLRFPLRTPYPWLSGTALPPRVLSVTFSDMSKQSSRRAWKMWFALIHPLSTFAHPPILAGVQSLDRQPHLLPQA